MVYLVGNDIPIHQSGAYRKWFDSLKNRKIRFVIDVRNRLVSLGCLGDDNPVSQSDTELRIDYGTGFKVYFVNRGTFM